MFIISLQFCIYPVFSLMRQLHQSVFQLLFQLLQLLSDRWPERLKLLQLKPVAQRTHKTNTHAHAHTSGLFCITLSQPENSHYYEIWRTFPQGLDVCRQRPVVGWLTAPGPTSGYETGSDFSSSAETLLPKTNNRNVWVRHCQTTNCTSSHHMIFLLLLSFYREEFLNAAASATQCLDNVYHSTPRCTAADSIVFRITDLADPFWHRGVINICIVLHKNFFLDF